MSPPFLLHRPLLVLLGFALCPIASRAEIAGPSATGPKSRRAEVAGPSTTVPKPRAGVVEVARGGTVRIPLGIYGLSSEQVTYVIRQGPTLGTLGEIEEADRSTGVVTYQQNGVLGPTDDHFTFAARNSAGVSAPAEIEIRIRDRPSLLIVPMRVIFDPTPVGSAVARSIGLENRGGGLLRGVVSIKPPWRIEGDPRYELGPGESGVISVVFEPTATGEQRSYLRFSSDPTRQTELRGRGLPPFAVEPEEVALDPSTRGGEITFRNHTAEPLALASPGDPRLLFDGTILLEPGGTATLPVTVAENAPEAFKTDLVFEGASHRETISVAAPAAPGALQAQPDRLDALDPETSGKLEVVNSGGSPVRVTVEAPRGITVQPRSFGLAPGRKETLTLLADRDALASGRLILVYGEGALEIPYALTKTEAPSPAVTPPPATVIKPHPAFPEAISTPSLALEGDLPGWIDPADARPVSLPAIGPIKVAEVTRHSATLTWPAAPGLTYQVEQRHVLLKNGQPEVEWSAAPEDHPVVDGEVGRVRFAGLQAGHLYTVRLYGENAQGEFTPPSATVAFQTLPPRSLLPRFRTVVLWALFALLFFLAYQKWRSGRPTD